MPLKQLESLETFEILRQNSLAHSILLFGTHQFQTLTIFALDDMILWKVLMMKFPLTCNTFKATTVSANACHSKPRLQCTGVHRSLDAQLDVPEAEHMNHAGHGNNKVPMCCQEFDCITCSGSSTGQQL